MESAVTQRLLGTLEGRPEWLRHALICDQYPSNELSVSQHAYIVELEQAACRVDDLESQRLQLVEQQVLLENQLTESRRRHMADIGMISSRFIEEAEERGYCSAYDEVVEDLNKNLYYELETRDRDFTVEIEVSGTLRVSVTANNSDHACELARDLVDIHSWDTNDSAVEIYSGSVDDYRILD